MIPDGWPLKTCRPVRLPVHLPPAPMPAEAVQLLNQGTQMLDPTADPVAPCPMPGAFSRHLP